MKLAALAVALLCSLTPALASRAAADAPADQITWAVHTTLVPTYFDTAETTIITSFMVLYALHDGVVKPMPGNPLAPSLAESWSVSPDGLFREQATELDRAKREAMLHRVQQLVTDKAMVAPMYELAFVNGVGRRVDEPGLGLIAGYAFSAPYEDLKLRTPRVAVQ